MKECSKCKIIKEDSEFYKDNRHTDGLFSECKKCKNNKLKENKKTKEGLLRKMYNSQTNNSRGNGKPIYSREEFISYGLNNNDFNFIYSEWVKSNYMHNKIPTTDRIDTLGRYELSNIRFLTFEDNYKRQSEERKKGIDNRVNLAVYKLDKNTEEIIEEYHSISEAGRKNNLEKANISKICNNYKTKKYKTKYQTCGGFKWKFKD